MALSLQSKEADPRFCDEVVNKLAKPLAFSTMQRAIRDLPPAKHTPIQRSSTHSSMSRPFSLPPEVLWMILDMLDFQSLSRLSRTSLLVRSKIERFPAYHHIMSYAPETLAALQRTGLLSYLSALQLRRALCSAKCVSCGHFGGYLFLPTCDRACFDCLRFDHALRVTTVVRAKTYFHLSDLQLKRIPIMRSIPGTYSMDRHRIDRNRSYRLVSVRQAKELAITVHGSVEAVQALDPQVCHRTIPVWRSDLLKEGFYAAPLEPPGRPCEINRWHTSKLHDDYAGMAVIRFPVLAEGKPDFGVLCLGCEAMNEEHKQGGLPDGVPPELYPSLGLYFPEHVLYSINNRLWDKPGFLQHVKNCYGMEKLLRYI